MKRLGRVEENQTFTLVQLLHGEQPGDDEFKVRYRWIQGPVQLERPIAKAERVIWILGRVIDEEMPGIAGNLPFRGIKALADTAGNRKTVVAASLREEAAWGDWGDSGRRPLQCGIAGYVRTDNSATLRVFLRNTGANEESVIQTASLFELECDGARYVHHGWQELRARSTRLPPGRKVGPILVNLTEYVSFDERMKGHEALHPLVHLVPGEHRVRAIYLGADRMLNIRGGEFRFASLAPEMPGPEAVE